MTKIEMLMEVNKTLRPADGWLCRSITNTKVVMEHPEHGKRICVLVNGDTMTVREAKP